MEKELAFAILSVEEPCKEEEIRAAYLRLLRSVNPEDDPEGFKRLRAAYETAVKLAGEQKSEEQRPEAQSDGLGEQLERIYQKIETRRDPEQWKCLLAQPVWEELDSAVEAERQMLAFLSGHNYLPHAIWLLLEKQFGFAENRARLEEECSGEFLDYLSRCIGTEDFIQFEYFQVRDSQRENVDAYLQHYFEIKRKIDAGEFSGRMRELDDLAAFGVYHPYEDVERVRVDSHEGNREAAGMRGAALLEKYQSDPYVASRVGDSYFRLGREEEAFRLWQGILLENPDYTPARMGCAKYQMSRKNYGQARKELETVIEQGGFYEEAAGLLHQANEILIPEYWEKISEGRGNGDYSLRELKLELGWCLFQNNRLEEGAAYLESLSREMESGYGFENLYGRVLAKAGQYEKAKPHLMRWLKLIEGLKDDGTEETKRRLKRRGLAAGLLGNCLMELEEKAEGEALLCEAVRFAQNRGEKSQWLFCLAQRYLQETEYGKAVDACERILKEESGFYPACIIHQEACYQLNDGQAVLNDYYRLASFALDIISPTS